MHVKTLEKNEVEIKSKPRLKIILSDRVIFLILTTSLIFGDIRMMWKNAPNFKDILKLTVNPILTYLFIYT